MGDDMTYEAFTLDVDGAVARVRFTQGDRGNPFDEVSTREFSEIATECKEDDRVRCVVITAGGRFFSVGGDLRSLGGDPRRFITNATVGFHSAVSRLARMNAPVVVGVHGLAAGGGVSLAAAADFVVAAESATFYAAYPAIGITADGGGSYFLPRRVGSRRAAAFYLLNETWSSERALEYGLVSEVVPDDQLAARLDELAAQLAAGPTVAFGEVKNLLLSSPDQTLEGQLELEARSMVRAAQTEDSRNAISAVASKQKPTFEGK